MPIIDAYGERSKAEVMKDTWGHLAPKSRCTYKGTILYTVGECGDITCIRSEFADLDGGPWLHANIQQFMCSNEIDEEAGKVYRFTGTYSIKHGFVGTIEIIDI